MDCLSDASQAFEKNICQKIIFSPSSPSGAGQNRHDQHFLSGPFENIKPVVRLQEGEILANRFTIKKHLGNGKFGDVYLADDDFRLTEVALKAVGLNGTKKDAVRNQLQNEIIINAFIHDFSHILQLYDLHLISQDNTNMLIQSMDYADGGTFRKWLQKYTDDLNARNTKGIDYFKQICLGMGSLYAAEILHLDIKPENLLLSKGEIKISDFGSAICKQLAKNSERFNAVRLYVQTGTPQYMSPEHFTASYPDEVDYRSDIYSLGILLYEIVHPKCRPPFAGSFERLRDFHLNSTIPDLSILDEKTAFIISRCLEKNPKKRFQDPMEIFYALEKSQGYKSGAPELVQTEGIRDQRKIENILGTAVASYNQGNLNGSIKLIEEIYTIDPEHQETKKLMEIINHRYHQAELLYNEIEHDFDSGEMSDLANILINAVKIYPNHPAGYLIQKKMGTKIEKYCKKMEEGLAKLQNNQWEWSLELFHKAFQINSESTELKMIIDKLTEIKSIRELINNALYTENFNRALQLASIVDNKVKNMKAGLLIFRDSQ